ncbi:NAD(P)-binding protein [Amniculicola lignicola CBS 123094]|uniref:NAD(P)-binding protein n=1 Tax=Amniculicola lignicola CBS 123094 TaxID=1392246 RepID=A0A6A5VZT7_9PLEO|nr:NAD(P)-binding protein [Amniculicola lignicola CBS 123094]
MPTVLIVGATRGLGASLAKAYTSQPGYTVLATARTSNPPANSTFYPPLTHHLTIEITIRIAKSLFYIPNIDLSTPSAGPHILDYLSTRSITKLDIIIITAGYFATESLASPSFDAQEKMYKTCAIGPTILVTALANSPTLLSESSKIILVSSESGSIALRHESEGGGNYGHHASKAALNMCAKLLALDLKERGVAVVSVHPGFMRTEMTRGVGFDKYWDVGGAVTPDVAAESLREWIETFDIGMTGQYWAPRGAADIGTAEPVLGPKDKLPIPLQLPW